MTAPLPSSQTTPASGADRPVRLGLPKGRMQDGVLRLMAEAGIEVRREPRGYRARTDFAGLEAKLLKPQNIVGMLAAGSRDIGFTGADWVAELDADLVELLDTELDPVRVVAAAPADAVTERSLFGREIVIASEYLRLARDWSKSSGLDARFLRSYGATEVFVPEDADCIVDNTATGSTLRANGLEILEILMRSSTRLYAHPRVMEDPVRGPLVEELVVLLHSVIEARRRVMLEVNVTADRLDGLIAVLPCMRQPTVSTLHREDGFAVKAAVPRGELPALISTLRAAGGTDLVITEPSQIVP